MDDGSAEGDYRRVAGVDLGPTRTTAGATFSPAESGTYTVAAYTVS